MVNLILPTNEGELKVRWNIGDTFRYVFSFDKAKLLAPLTGSFTWKLFDPVAGAVIVALTCTIIEPGEANVTDAEVEVELTAEDSVDVPEGTLRMTWRYIEGATEVTVADGWWEAVKVYL